MNKKKKDEFHYTPSKSEINESINELKGNIDSILLNIDTPIEDMMPPDNFLPSIDFGENTQYDYEKDIQLIKINAKETLECIANLYLTEEIMKTKNIYRIIKDDADKIAELNFSISCTKKALIQCLRQLDMGVNDPLMYQSVAIFQKEMRDTIKMAYELQMKMKIFYKELKDEVPEINIGVEQTEINPLNNMTIIGDPRMLNDIYESYKKDPTLLNDANKQ